jgi:hypothetical protein
MYLAEASGRHPRRIRQMQKAVVLLRDNLIGARQGQRYRAYEYRITPSSTLPKRSVRMSSA